MTTAIGRLFRRFDRRKTEREIDEQLRFHIDLLTQELLEREMSSETAKQCALNRFGNVELIKAQCIEISNRNRPVLRGLKSLLILVFLVGGLVRFLGTDYHVTQIGDVSIMVAVLGRLLFHVRGLNPPGFHLSPKPSSPLMLDLGCQTSDAQHDQKGTTTVER